MTVKENEPPLLPGYAGVPETTPLLKVKPVGSVPARVIVYGGTPPAACTVPMYGKVKVAAGRFVVMVREADTLMVTEADLVVSLTDVAVTVSLIALDALLGAV